VPAFGDPEENRIRPSRYGAHAQYDLTVPSPTRLTAVVLGLAAVLYGTASLTGGWLGTPPWWERRTSLWFDDTDRLMPPGFYHSPTSWVEPRSGRERISGGVVATGLALAAFGAWPRRRTGRAS
jgi:hypothetical protein